MSQNPYIGQAQISMQIKHEGYAVGDWVIWRSAQVKDKATRYLVEGFDGDRVILRNGDADTWSPIAEWFVKVEQAERPHDDDVDVLARFVSLNVSESSDIDAVSEIADIVQSSVTKLDAGSSSVTITISREDAEGWASDDDHIHATAWGLVDEAIRAALEGER